MTKLTTGELKIFSNILIQGGYVLDLSNAEFRQIILSATGIDVHEDNYLIKVSEEMGSSSKGKTLTYFCHHESDANVLKVLGELIDYAENIDDERHEIDLNKINKAKAILNKYNNPDLIIGDTTEEKIDNLINDINQSITNGKPEFTLDRLHTLMKNYFKGLCDKHKIEYENRDQLNQLVSRYSKCINKQLDSEFSKTILNQTGANFKKFNEIRNHKSYAHDNDILNRAESLLIYRNIVAIYEFTKTIENDIL